MESPSLEVKGHLTTQKLMSKWYKEISRRCGLKYLSDDTEENKESSYLSVAKIRTGIVRLEVYHYVILLVGGTPPNLETQTR
jgi:hypothetical protein